MRTKLVDGKIIELSAEENQARDAVEQEWSDGQFEREINGLRQQRNARLAVTDYRALSDQSLTQEWLDYRQQLRDLTLGLETVEDVESVVWPIEPE